MRNFGYFDEISPKKKTLASRLGRSISLCGRQASKWRCSSRLGRGVAAGATSGTPWPPLASRRIRCEGAVDAISFTFVTNVGKHGPFGEPRQGTPFSVPLQNGARVVGVLWEVRIPARCLGCLRASVVTNH